MRGVSSRMAARPRRISSSESNFWSIRSTSAAQSAESLTRAAAVSRWRERRRELMARAPARSPCTAAAAARSNWSVTLAMALTTTTGCLAQGHASGHDGRGAAMAAGSSTDVPPNFMTTRLMRVSHGLKTHQARAAAAATGSPPQRRGPVAGDPGSSLPRLASNSALRMAAPAAPRMVLCESTVNFQSSTPQGRRRPTVTAMPLPRLRSRRGCGRSFCGAHSTGCSGALGRFLAGQRDETPPRRPESLRAWPACPACCPA